jgi:hypothetical protein
VNRRSALWAVATLALVVASTLVDLATGAAVPGRTAVFSLGAAAVLVLGAKWLGAAGVSRPAGSRVGELGDPRDDLDHAAPWEQRDG